MRYEDEQLKLFCPEETRTADSAAVLWNKVKGARQYRVFLDGAEVGRTEHTDFTLRGLKSGRGYEIEAAAEDENGRLAQDTLHIALQEKGEELTITSFDEGDGCKHFFHPESDRCLSGRGNGADSGGNLCDGRAVFEE